MRWAHVKWHFQYDLQFSGIVRMRRYNTKLNFYGVCKLWGKAPTASNNISSKASQQI